MEWSHHDESRNKSCYLPVNTCFLPIEDSTCILWISKKNLLNFYQCSCRRCKPFKQLTIKSFRCSSWLSLIANCPPDKISECKTSMVNGHWSIWTPDGFWSQSNGPQAMTTHDAPMTQITGIIYDYFPRRCQKVKHWRQTGLEQHDEYKSVSDNMQTIIKKQI